ncbi:MAG TPA: sialate O-acetylesterase [Ignavibacteriaceae bacterium]|nr:sialate O-acetylesterase [Ignavibacteriaceae bacterium]
MLILSVIISFLTMMNSDSKSSIQIPSIFSDNMVLQRNTEVPFWGKASRKEKVTVKGSWGKSAETSADEEGNWKTKLETPEAGGPYEVTIRIGDSVVTYKNVLIGEVWICSGQSNMEMPMEGWPPRDTVQNWAGEIKNAKYPEIRMFTVQRAFSNKKEFNCSGSWEICSPSSAHAFSATAYFFGRELYSELSKGSLGKIPIGLIQTSWGGTPIQSWMSDEYLKNLEEYKSVVNSLENSSGEFEKYLTWLNSFPAISVINKPDDLKWKGLDFKDAGCSEISFQDSSWKEMNLPTLWERADIGNFDGAVWFRKKIEIPSGWMNKDLVLELGPIDDMDLTYVNGTLVGSYEKLGYWSTDRVYNIPGKIITVNQILIAVRVLDTQGGGGIYGAPEKMKLHPQGSEESISLAGSWKYLPVAQYRDQKFYVFGSDDNKYNSKPALSFVISENTPTALFNAMVNPVVPYTIKGAIWYQGEANVGEPEEYAKLFPLMIRNWRNEWGGGDFPFYYVQIAPFNYGENSYSEKLREAQLKTLAVPNTGMAVTLDIGNPDNIHPADKQDVGKRLALWALNKTYGKKIPFTGPILKSFDIKGNKVILSFDHADKLFLKELNGENNFIIADSTKIFKKAEVEVDGNKLIISSPEIEKPAAVRYAWSNTSQATLFNEAGLPASSFRTDDWNN